MDVLEKMSRRPRRGTVIVEFALTVPFLFIIVFGVIDFSRAYSELNAMNAALREGARTASVMTKETLTGATAQSLVRKKVRASGGVFGYSVIDTNLVTLIIDPNLVAPEFVTVRVTAHPVPLPVLGKFLGISPFTVTRSVRYRWERAPNT
jgi:Flp pilus assembly protein TadG